MQQHLEQSQKLQATPSIALATQLPSALQAKPIGQDAKRWSNMPGAGATAANTDSVAIGIGAETTKDDQIVLGTNAAVVTIPDLEVDNAD